MRPRQKGLTYLPLDVAIFQDRKIRRLQRACGPVAPLVYIAVLTMIFKEGYYISWDEDLCLDLADLLHISEEEARGCIDGCFEVGLLSRSMMDSNHILTSRGIQRQFDKVCRQARRQGGVDEYSLLPVQSEETDNSSDENMVSSAETEVSSAETAENAAAGTQNKEKKNKVYNNTPLLFPPIGEEKEKMVYVMTFERNYVDPNGEYERMVAYNSGPAARKKWASMDSGERMAALVLWRQQPQRPRWDASWLNTWKAIYDALAASAPASVRKDMLSDSLKAQREGSRLMLTCSASVRDYLEDHLDVVGPVLKTYLKKIECKSLVYDVLYPTIGE